MYTNIYIKLFKEAIVSSSKVKGSTTETYTYTNYHTGKVVFECIAQNIIEADTKYMEVTGKDPAKQNYVGCS